MQNGFEVGDRGVEERADFRRTFHKSGVLHGADVPRIGRVPLRVNGGQVRRRDEPIRRRKWLGNYS